MNHPLATLCDQFLKERTFLNNVTPATLIWYRVAFKNYSATLVLTTVAADEGDASKQFVIGQRERGVRPVTCNTYVGAMNAFCRWLHEEGHVAHR